MTRKIIQLEVVEKIPKNWETFDKHFGKGRSMSFFPLNENANYQMVEQDTGNRIETHLTYQTEEMKVDDTSLSILLYGEVIEQLKNGDTILVDETVLKISEGKSLS